MLRAPTKKYITNFLKMVLHILEGHQYLEMEATHLSMGIVQSKHFFEDTKTTPKQSSQDWMG